MNAAMTTDEAADAIWKLLKGRGPMRSRQIVDHTIGLTRSRFLAAIGSLRRRNLISVIDRVPGPTGLQNYVWKAEDPR